MLRIPVGYCLLNFQLSGVASAYDGDAFSDPPCTPAMMCTECAGAGLTCFDGVSTNASTNPRTIGPPGSTPGHIAIAQI
ncbi:hypothetical protein HaLaN_08822 [Haematococcus lacustris]|uniref:Uncharacterized protein n=1 Tax=Haematococcus lacustris TaxID=44745 RepID=A0A699YS36_HAELA|nr:hypothetical protein HaLaN_08822 [Haematococcus lacustris]